MRRLLFFAPLSLFLALAIYFAAGLNRDPAQLPSMLIDRPVPEFALPPIEGKAEGLSSENLRGEATLVNVFASWCPPCAEEQPVLMRIAREGGAPIMGLNWKDKPGDGARFLARYGDPYARIGDDRDGRVAVDFGVTGAPETFVVDAEGRVRHKHVGPITPQVWRNVLRPMIEQLNASRSDSGALDAS
jgi:cytochrome c biogenesis protein CcmG/thiol:disulfide interchange protein DsbE